MVSTVSTADGATKGSSQNERLHKTNHSTELGDVAN